MNRAPFHPSLSFSPGQEKRKYINIMLMSLLMAHSSVKWNIFSAVLMFAASYFLGRLDLFQFDSVTLSLQIVSDYCRQDWLGLLCSIPHLMCCLFQVDNNLVFQKISVAMKHSEVSPLVALLSTVHWCAGEWAWRTALSASLLPFPLHFNTLGNLAASHSCKPNHNAIHPNKQMEQQLLSFFAT